MNIPLTKPYFDTKEEKAVISSLRSGWHSQGPQTEAFENEFSRYTDAKYSIAVSNCTTALHLSLLLLGVNEKDEVIVPSFTYIASVNVIRHVGAMPVFADVDDKTFNIDPLDIERKITKKTKAIIAVDQVGMPCDFDVIDKIAKKHKLVVLEDAACALGSKYKNRKVGSLTKLTCFSLHPRKVISSGEGGVITTNDKKLAQLAKELRSHGASVSAHARHLSKKISFESYAKLGYNYRISDFQSAIARQQLKKLPEILIKRKKLSARYSKQLSNLSFLETPFVPGYASPNWQTYIIKLKEDRKFSQKKIMQKLLDAGIATRKGVMASHLEPYYLKLLGKKSLPVTERLVRSTISIPLYPQMTLKEQDYVISNIKKIYANKS